jgi:hypothetical protein
MGRAWRIAAPRKAKVAKRAVTRPAKTARQLATPKPVKKAASTSWRVAHPQTGVRQEVEGRAIAKTRRALFRKPRGKGAPVASVETAKRDGWTPARVGAEQVPVLRDCAQFHAIDAELRAARRELDAAGTDEAAFAAVCFSSWAYAAQADLIAQLTELVAEDPDPAHLPFLAWTEDWRTDSAAAMQRLRVQHDELVGRLDAATVAAGEDRVEQRVNALLARTVP